MDYRNPQSPMFPQTADSCDCSYCGCDCVRTGVQYADITTPISVEPHVKIGGIETEYIGVPDVCCTESRCKNVFNIVLTQKLRITIPIQYGVTACVEESDITCRCDEPYCE